KDISINDMSENVTAKGKLDALMESLVSRDADFKNTLQRTVHASNHLSDAITHITINMQFQDHNSQIVDNCMHLLHAFKPLIAEFIKAQKDSATFDPDTQAALVALITKNITLSAIKQRFLSSLLHHGVATPQLSAPSADKKDIELF